MELSGKTAIVTGAGRGIGAALARAFAESGANVVVADLDEANAKLVAEKIGGLGFGTDVTREEDILALVQVAEEAFGPVDLFCSNAGIGLAEPSHAASASNEVWQKNWDVHVMAHVYAARAELPGMIERGAGYLVQIASAAGLLNQIGDAAYSATKHAAVSFAESLAITHRDDGIKVSVVCPQYVATPLIGHGDAERADSTALLTVDDVARAVVAGVAAEQFLILPHARVADYMALKAADYERWLTGMSRLRGKVIDDLGEIDISELYRFT